MVVNSYNLPLKYDILLVGKALILYYLDGLGYRYLLLENLKSHYLSIRSDEETLEMNLLAMNLVGGLDFSCKSFSFCLSTPQLCDYGVDAINFCIDKEFQDIIMEACVLKVNYKFIDMYVKNKFNNSIIMSGYSVLDNEEREEFVDLYYNSELYLTRNKSSFPFIDVDLLSVNDYLDDSDYFFLILESGVYYLNVDSFLSCYSFNNKIFEIYFEIPKNYYLYNSLYGFDYSDYKGLSPMVDIRRLLYYKGLDFDTPANISYKHFYNFDDFDLDNVNLSLNNYFTILNDSSKLFNKPLFYYNLEDIDYWGDDWSELESYIIPLSDSKSNSISISITKTELAKLYKSSHFSHSVSDMFLFLSYLFSNSKQVKVNLLIEEKKENYPLFSYHIDYGPEYDKLYETLLELFEDDDYKSKLSEIFNVILISKNVKLDLDDKSHIRKHITEMLSKLNYLKKYNVFMDYLIYPLENIFKVDTNEFKSHLDDYVYSKYWNLLV